MISKIFHSAWFFETHSHIVNETVEIWLFSHCSINQVYCHQKWLKELLIKFCNNISQLIFSYSFQFFFHLLSCRRLFYQDFELTLSCRIKHWNLNVLEKELIGHRAIGPTGTIVQEHISAVQVTEWFNRKINDQKFIIVS